MVVVGWLANFFANTATQIMGVTVIGALILAALAALLGCLYWHRLRIKDGKTGVEPSHVIATCLVGAALLMMVATGAYIWQQFFSSPASQGAEDRNAVSKVEFAGNGIIATHDIYGPYGPQLVTYVADLIANGERLRVFVDYSMLVPPNNIANGWVSRNRVQIAEFIDYVRGQKLIVPVLSGYEQDGNKNLMRWGAVTPDLPDGNHIFALTNTYRARLVLMGSNGREQYHYFLIVRAARPDGLKFLMPLTTIN